METSTKGYAHRDMLADTDWLFAHLQDPAVRIVDTENREVYRCAHIAGAVGYTGNPFLKDQGTVLGPEPFAALMAELGISNDTLVVAYDAANSLYATRLWWVLKIDWYDRAVAAEWTIAKLPRTTWRGTPLHELWLTDPDGNLIEIYARLTDTEWAERPADYEPVLLVPRAP